ncbi:S8 family peptidase [Saccharothrix texasensis]|uniref:Subtilase family protein n=1 Tax=Saccharothrix texasensis TaxID=103734 RepID=A0A3N1HJI0_9PSEU|nr:S8 family serine peptidase [Saccharothrix texasensis]ROP42656.1 subtilase family protein [Saccharothrix texasensis]
MRFAQRLDEHGDLHVLPTDVLGDVRSGVLDDRLFDVTALIRAGYDDRSTRVTPLIVTSTGPVVAGEPLPGIGAPRAWQSGHTGAGAKVAVLDTGVDPTHPDLVGAVVESRDFTDSPDADDHVGHGTHVAATITGSGRYQGVAPDSAVLNGKVLDDHGGGYESEWRARSPTPT